MMIVRRLPGWGCSCVRGASDRQRPGAARAVHRVRRHSGPSPALLAGNPGRGLRRFRFAFGSDLLVGTMARAGLAATPRQPALAPRPDAVGDLPPLSRTASLATALGRQTGVPVRARPGPPRAIADWYITVRGGPPPLRQGGPFSLPGKITNVTIFHEPVRCSRCPLEPGLPCAGRGVRRLCELVDPAHPAYNPAYLTLLRPKVNDAAVPAGTSTATPDRSPPAPGVTESLMLLAG